MSEHSPLDPPPRGKTADEYIAEAAAAEPLGARRRSRSRSRSAPDAPGGAAVVDPPAEPEPEARKLTPTFTRLREGVLGVYTAAQMGAQLLDPEAAAIIGATKEDCADAWIELAEKDVKVKNMLTKLTTGAGWGGVVMAHMTLVIPILAKRGWVPGGALFGGQLMNSMSGVAGADVQQQQAEARADGVRHYADGLGVVTVP